MPGDRHRLPFWLTQTLSGFWLLVTVKHRLLEDLLDFWRPCDTQVKREQPLTPQREKPEALES